MSNGELVVQDRKDLDLAYKYYQSGLTLNEVASKCGLKSGTTILRYFQQAGLKTRPRGGAVKSSQAGYQNGNWKGGRVGGRKVYIRIWKPDHPNADIIGYVFEHDLIAERALGRHLRLGEIVHHINCQKNDNRPSNLLICTQSYHASLHHRRRKNNGRKRA